MARRSSREAFVATFAEWQGEYVRVLYEAVYDAALPLTDEEIQRIVDEALNRARMALSS